MLAGVHVMFAQATDTPEFQMDEDEATRFLKAAQNVLRHYAVETTQVTLDWAAFVGVATMVYGSRITAIGMRKRREREEKRAAPVVSFPHGQVFNQGV